MAGQDIQDKLISSLRLLEKSPGLVLVMVFSNRLIGVRVMALLGGRNGGISWNHNKHLTSNNLDPKRHMSDILECKVLKLFVTHTG